MAGKRYGYKPRAVSMRGFSARQILEIMKDPAIRIFRVPFGRHEGESRMAGNVPWAGATEGATSTSDAIAKLRAVNPRVAANCERFASGAVRGATGMGFWTYPDGVTVRMPRAAIARAKKGYAVIER